MRMLATHHLHLKEAKVLFSVVPFKTKSLRQILSAFFLSERNFYFGLALSKISAV